MSKGGGSRREDVRTTSTDREPPEFQKPFLEQIFSGAQSLYESDVPNYFPESTVVDFAPETELALEASTNRALSGSELQRMGRGQMESTLRGDYLAAGNPYMDAAFNSAANLVTPRVASQFAGAGRYGSGAATGEMTRQLGELAGNMAFQNYQTERNRQVQAMNQAPQYAQMDYLDANTLSRIGSAREAQAQSQLQDSINRHNFEQTKEAQKLGTYLGLVGGGYGFEQTGTEPIYYNPVAGGIGGALAGAQLGSYFGSPGVGAAAGGLLGLLG